MPIRDLECLACGKKWDALIRNEEELKAETCATCGSGEIQVCMSLFGGYSIQGNNSASVTPRKFRGGK